MESAELEAKIGELEAMVRGSLFQLSPRDGNFWRGVWDLIREIGPEFTTTRFPTIEDKQDAQQRFQGIVDDVKRQQERYLQQKGERQRDRKAIEERSEHAKREIISAAGAAWPHEDGFMEFLALITGAKLIADLVIGTVELLVDVATMGLLRPTEKDERKARLLACSAQMKKAWELYKSHRDDLLQHDRDEVKKVLIGVQGELTNEWDKYKAEGKERWEQREREFAENREAKSRLISEVKQLARSHIDAQSRGRAKELFQEWRAIRSGGRDYDDSLWTEFREALDAFYDQSKDEYRKHVLSEIEKLEGKIEKAKANNEVNRERLANARGDDFSEKVQGWIDDGETLISKYENWLDEWHEKLKRLDSR